LSRELTFEKFLPGLMRAVNLDLACSTAATEDMALQQFVDILNSQVKARIDARTSTHTHTYTYAHTLIHTCTHTHIYMHTHACTHTHTHTHTHIFATVCGHSQLPN